MTEPDPRAPAEGAAATGRYAASNAAQQRLHELVPGGAHTYARGADQYPEDMAPILVRGRGARVVDLDGHEYVEYGMGLRSVTLGHAYQPVVEAVRRAIGEGTSFTRPTELELRAAETFLAQVPGADMVKFTKNGSDATTAAVKLARAATGRRHVAICRSQPFFSTDDWFIGTTPMNAGTLPEESALTLGFDYNDLDSLRAVLAAHPGDVACVILEAGTALAEPAPGFLEGLRALADRDGFVLVFDEMITGMRWSLHGAQHVYGVTPDLSTWGKALGNGFAISALAGRRELMELGGLRTSGRRVFLLSTTHGPETAGLAAYLAVERSYRERDVVGEMERQGVKLAEAVTEEIRVAGLEDHVEVTGRPSCLVFVTRDADGKPSQAHRTLFLQELLKHGVLGQSFVISAAHTDEDIELTVGAVRHALQVYRRSLGAGGVDGLLHGRPVAPALRERSTPRRLGSTGAVVNQGEQHHDQHHRRPDHQ
ncbi:glutamate-1-semialdehyde 2,1-aminomutase [Nocardioides guangzhouensis]|uniref:Glutamate-1-semialdehyde 2,1-aminomutase n=1 Tax=Nocardioides guangzhouensis TaxID=2497878 RepID=A0A4V1XZ55_9ACTN|nr:glutamate-1-semialdehyde 2,1-aminomutase [Nocardioides guangzhouensis]RYP85569.1 glutamate-1-semialdehyde 2,1-aminomutase [Nocardioides guangzhouensis]